MAKEISLLLFDTFNDRGCTSSYLTTEFQLAASDIEVGAPLPGWQWTSDAPAVQYYDGQYMIVEYGGKTYETGLEYPPARLFKARNPENIHVVEHTEAKLRINDAYKVGNPPAWHLMYKYNSFHALILHALPLAETDGLAALWFKRVFTIRDHIFRLLPSTIEALEESASRHNPYALFGLGRYHEVRRPDADSPAKAFEYYRKALERGGLEEAKVALALQYYFGDTGMAQREKGKKMLHEALEAACDYAAERQINNMIFGFLETDVDPENAIRICDQLIARDREQYGAEHVNPVWYYLKGVALQDVKGLSAGREEFKSACDAGMNRAWATLGEALGTDAETGASDWEVIAPILQQGVGHRSALCMYYLAERIAKEYDRLPGYKRASDTPCMHRYLEEAVELGSDLAADFLGEAYFMGLYGFPEDNARAFEYLAKGALFDSVSCMEKLYVMMEEHYVEKSLEFKDMVAIAGARRGSAYLTGETLKAYAAGRLTEFALEIEKYYVPASGDKNDAAEDRSAGERK